MNGPRGDGYRRVIAVSAARRGGTPDDVGTVSALLMGPDGGSITGNDFLMDGGVTAGCGWTQCEGEPIVRIRAGDVIWCPPGHKHWHGATPTTAMTHIAVQEALDGKNVDWLQKVTDEEYLAGPAADALPD